MCLQLTCAKQSTTALAQCSGANQRRELPCAVRSCRNRPRAWMLRTMSCPWGRLRAAGAGQRELWKKRRQDQRPLESGAPAGSRLRMGSAGLVSGGLPARRLPAESNCRRAPSRNTDEAARRSVLRACACLCLAGWAGPSSLFCIKPQDGLQSSPITKMRDQPDQGTSLPPTRRAGHFFLPPPPGPSSVPPSPSLPSPDSPPHAAAQAVRLQRRSSLPLSSGVEIHRGVEDWFLLLDLLVS